MSRTTGGRTAKRGRKPKPRASRRRSPSGDIDTALALLAHEIRTPLNGILAFSELLAASDLPARERQWAAAIKSAATHLDHFTTLAIEQAKAGSGKVVLRSEAFRPHGLAETLAAALTARAEAKGLAAAIRIAPDLPEVVVGDPVRLRSALENLIDNAVKFTDRGKVSLSVMAEPAGKRRLRLSFAVSDEGIGLTPAERRRLFRPFAQANPSIARRFGGSGLGLAFVKRVAAAMGGKLTLANNAGRGSTFTLAIKVNRAEPRDMLAGGNRSAPSPQRSHLRILCAEDNPHGRIVVNTLLAALGHAVDFVGTGTAAVEAARQAVYDLVLMDVTLPVLDGIEATRRIRALPGGAGRIPVLGISAHGGGVEEAAARAAGMDGYLVKPVSVESLAAAIVSLLPAGVASRRPQPARARR